jgi:hypothetical protein
MANSSPAAVMVLAVQGLTPRHHNCLRKVYQYTVPVASFMASHGYLTACS